MTNITIVNNRKDYSFYGDLGRILYEGIKRTNETLNTTILFSSLLY